jgi:hypothetical protein
MNGQPSQFDDYPAHGVVSASGALVRAWSALENFHSDLVVVGGLAIHFHTRQVENPLYRPTPTLDVDFGMTLAADAGLAAPAAFALMQAGFRETEEGRMYLDSEEGKLFVDFLTEHPPATSGSRNVSDLKASICPGIQRALGNPIKREVDGRDHLGDFRTFRIPFCNYGPLLVLKINAFAQRNGAKRGKDAYDILSLVRSCVDGPERVVAAFGEEKHQDNAGLRLAMETLERHFKDADGLGPTLAASFYLGTRAGNNSTLRLREDLVTVASALLNS